MNRTPKLAGAPALLALLFCASATLALAHGEDGDHWPVPEAEAARENPAAMTSEGLERARKVYDKQCVMCHGRTGSGDGQVAKTMGIHPADLTDGDMVSAMSDGEIFYKITTGREPMPSFRKKIEEEDRWLLVHLVRSFGSGGEDQGRTDAAK